ncbi:MAG TPA: N-acetylglucosamine-6-phosphate deacetylase [Chitinophagaceae bacterium]|nr:N-acetylglucosamine-6-phosphate deacetylase [Chitinophagaceae bacterium]
MPYQIFTGTEWLTDYAILIENGAVTELIPQTQLPEDIPAKKYEGFFAPAFIDLQIYGAHKKLLAVYPEPETLSQMQSYCASGGAVQFLPTVATNTKEVFYKCIDAVRQYWQERGQGVHGLHLEGPWINEEKRGAHIKELIHSPMKDEVIELLEYGKGVIKMITLAPEVCSAQLMELIKSYDIIISAGHSNVTYDQAIEHFENGVTTVTHLYNAMSPLHHRSPGLVGAAFMHDRVMASIIADGHHVDFSAIKIAKEIMKERLFVITDAVTETDRGYYQHQLNADKYECNGVLSGSALTMYRSFVNLVKKTGIEIAEALRMCSLYPAQVIKTDHLYGKIAPGYAAQFVVINKELNLVDVITL